MKENEKNTGSRRNFLKSAWKYLGAIAIAEGLLVSFTFFRSRKTGGNVAGSNLRPVAGLSDIPPGTIMPFRSGLFYLVRLEDGGLMAVSMVCSHLGCTVNWDAAEKVFKCPCHSSSFDRLGNVIKSPATSALNYYRVTVDKGQVLVDLGNAIVKNKFDPSVVTYV